MPELPDVELFKKYLDKHALGKKIDEVEVLENKVVRGVSEKKFKEAFENDSFKKTERHGKWLIARTSKGKTLAMHFGMTGKLVVTSHGKQRPPFSRVEFDFKGKEKLSFADRRKIDGMELVESREDLIRRHRL